jgi:hypothetical protein
MDRTRRDYLFFGAIAALVFLAVLLLTDRIKSREDMSFSRAIDTVNIGTTANDGTGDPLRTAFAKINDVIIMLDSLDMELLTNDEMQALKDLEDLTDAVLFHVGDTTVTAAVGKVVFKTSNSHFYGCVATSGKKWKQLDQ